MQQHFKDNLAPMWIGLLLVLLTFAYGFGLGAAFGAAEDKIKGHLEAETQAVLDEKYGGDETKAKKVRDKSWTYFKRAHLHANGLAAASLGMILLLSFLAVGNSRKRYTSLALGIGGLGYSMYWMFAGLRAPGMGSTGAAKASLEWLAVPTSALCILGLLSVLIALCRTAMK